jgi:hypothetical protein
MKFLVEFSIDGFAAKFQKVKTFTKTPKISPFRHAERKI